MVLKKEKLDDYHYHEVMDRASVATDHFYDYVAEHPAVQANSELKEKADAVVNLMYEFYSLAGAYSVEDVVKEGGIKRATHYEYEE